MDLWLESPRDGDSYSRARVSFVCNDDDESTQRLFCVVRPLTAWVLGFSVVLDGWTGTQPNPTPDCVFWDETVESHVPQISGCRLNTRHRHIYKYDTNDLETHRNKSSSSFFLKLTVKLTALPKGQQVVRISSTEIWK